MSSWTTTSHHSSRKSDVHSLPNAFLLSPNKPARKELNSIGKMNLVEGLVPMIFKVSRYCRLMVFESTSLAASHIFLRARANPSAGNPLRSPGEVLDLDHAGDWVKDSRIDEKVDGDRRIVLRDTGLVRDLQIRLTEVHPNGPIDDRNDDHKTRPLRPWEDFAQTEDDDALIFRDDLDAGEQEDHNHHDCDRQFDGHGDLLIPGDLGVMAMEQTSDGRNDGSTVHETTSDV